MKRQKHSFDTTKYKKLPDRNSDDESGEETELLVPRKFMPPEPPSIEKDIEEGDTLQALSIRYHCTVAELKRLNHIQNDNEMFAKRTIKIPHRLLSILAGVHSSGRNSPNGKQNGRKDVDSDLLENKLHTFLTIPSNNSLEQTSFNEIIFNSNILRKSCDISDNEATSDEEVDLLPNNTPVESIVVSRFSCSGADADISWIALIVCVVILIFAVPLIYVFYVAEHLEQYHTHHHHSNHNL